VIAMTRLAMMIALVVMCASLAAAAQWATGDGLTVTLDDTTGAVESVQLDGEELPLAPDALGGLCYSEFALSPDDPPEVLLALDFEGDEQTWTSAKMAEWDTEETWAQRPAGEGYLRIGGHAGDGMAAREAFKVPLRGLCRVSWRGRSRTTAQSYILCMRLFDADGRDITATTPPPRGWTHSPYSNAHYRVDIRNSKPDTWQEFARDYLVPEQVAAVRVSLRVYTGDDAEGYIDDLRVTVQPGGWSEEVPIIGTVEADAGGLVQRAEMPGHDLTFVTRYATRGDRLAATVEVSSPRARCLSMTWRLPLALDGWTWEADPRAAEPVTATSNHSAGPIFAKYPVASVDDGSVGLAMSVVPDQPAVQTMRATRDGLATVVEMGVSPAAPHARRSFSFELSRDDPAWGFRSALARFYEGHPDLFEVSSPRGAVWTLKLPPADTPDVEDFRLAFYECGGIGEDARRQAREQGMLTLRYTEPWGMRQSFPDAENREDMPPYDERLAQLREWAADTNSDEKWRGLPRAQVAAAVLNSLMLNPDGVGAYLEDKYTHWAMWWQLNPSPHLAEPNRATIAYATEIDPSLEWADGIYLDSVSIRHCLDEDHDPAHLAAARCPLTFSLRTGAPMVLSGMANYEFMADLRERLLARGKLLMMNLFPPATALYGHLADITGCELAGPQPDDQAMQQRIWAHQRPVSNLLQWKFAVLNRVPAWTPEEARQYFDNQLLYGFWPGISTAGGGTEPGYRGMHRYFREPGMFERDRELWREYLPVFDELNAAGWEPVTRARCEPATVRVERFGSGGIIYLTVHNHGDEPADATLSLEREWWTGALGGEPSAALRLPEGACELAEDGDAIACALQLAAKQTIVVSLSRG